MKAGRIAVIAGAALASAVVLAACKPEERGRILNYQPGVYKGTPDTALTAEQTRRLRARTAFQSGTTSLSAGGGTPAGRGSDVRRPASAPLDTGELAHRGSLQKDKY